MNFYRDCPPFKLNIPDCITNKLQIMQFKEENQQKNYAGQIYIFFIAGYVICTLFHLKTKHFILCYPDPLINQGSLEYYGQIPWRPGKLFIEPPVMELEQKEISALLCPELIKALIPFCSNSIPGGSMETFPGLQDICS